MLLLCYVLCYVISGNVQFMLPVSNRPGCKIVITRQMQKFVCGLYLVFPHTNMLTLISIAATRLSVYRETPWCEI